MRRGFAVSAVYVVVILMPFVIAGVLVPPIVAQANNLATNAPRYAHDLADTFRALLQLVGVCRPDKEIDADRKRVLAPPLEGPPQSLGVFNTGIASG